jgi:hypothetical protein
VNRLGRAHRDLAVAAEALMALRRGDEGGWGKTGAVLLAEGLDHLRIIADFCRGISRGRR